MSEPTPASRDLLAESGNILRRTFGPDEAIPEFLSWLAERLSTIEREAVDAVVTSPSFIEIERKAVACDSLLAAGEAWWKWRWNSSDVPLMVADYELSDQLNKARALANKVEAGPEPHALKVSGFGAGIICQECGEDWPCLGAGPEVSGVRE